MTRKNLRTAAFIMLIIGVIFVGVAVTTPTLGQVRWIGSFEFGPRLWRICYMGYAVITLALFVGSFFAKK